jgi:hypothetical protein
MKNIIELIPDLETRKKHTSYLTRSVSNFLEYFTSNDEIKAYIIIFIHYLIVVPPMFYLIFGKVDKLFYVFILLWVIIFSLHFYFNGCIFIRIERELLKDKDWRGQWTPVFFVLKKFNIEPTTGLINNIFICWGILVSLLILLRLIFNF